MSHATGPTALEVLDSPVRRRIVDLLGGLASAADPATAASGLTAAELGARLGLHVTTARFHLDQLEAHGLVESAFERGRVGRPRKVYRTPTRVLTEPPPDPGAEADAIAEMSRLLAETWQESEDGRPLTPEQAGRRWALAHAPATGRDDGGAAPPDPARTVGAWLAKVGGTVDLLHRWGYRPDVRTTDGGREVELVLPDCPLMTLAKARPDVVCGVHRGLLRGALEALGETDVEVALHPFVEDRLCLAHLSRHLPSPPS